MSCSRTQHSVSLTGMGKLAPILRQIFVKKNVTLPPFSHSCYTEWVIMSYL